MVTPGTRASRTSSSATSACRVRRHRPAGLRHARPPHRDQGRRGDGLREQEGHRGIRRRELHRRLPGVRRGEPRQSPVRLHRLRRLDGLGRPVQDHQPRVHGGGLVGFAQAHERDLVEQGMRSITQCPRCETAIANNEVEYEDVEDPSIYVKFPSRTGKGSSSSGRRRRGPSPQTPSLPSTATSTTSASTPRKTARPSGSTSPKSASRTSCTRAATTTTRSSRN